ncbi:MAG: fructosamine kinase family protein [Anaerolineae bacterium]|nr:fructosamine kinase family protein [Gloeobacterales cyanobacterium ES-bin-313]
MPAVAFWRRSVWNQVAEAIATSLGKTFTIASQRSLSGGSINQTFMISGDGQRYFVKANNDPIAEAMFKAEQLGLEELQSTKSIRIPQPICSGKVENTAFLVLEWLPLGSSGNWEAMGQALATLHRTESKKGFGWHRSNTIGSTPQHNPWTEDWPVFFGEHRLGFQLRLAEEKGYRIVDGERLLEMLPKLLDHNPKPSLLHGDLWSGNAGFADGEPSIFDPAIYYGDRETDLAMTELFGGFPAAFYTGYQSIYPLDSGYEDRKAIYNLYHILNHLNLFGGGYLSQANRMIQQILHF